MDRQLGEVTDHFVVTWSQIAIDLVRDELRDSRPLPRDDGQSDRASLQSRNPERFQLRG